MVKQAEFEQVSPAPVLPNPDMWTEPFWDFAKKGQLAIQRCTGCTSYRYPPSPICPKCWSKRFDWRVVSGKGRVVSWVVFHQNYYPGATFKVPYNVVMVTLDEGPTLISNLIGIDNGLISFGLEVEVVFSPISGDIKLPQFKPTMNEATNV